MHSYLRIYFPNCLLLDLSIYSFQNRILTYLLRPVSFPGRIPEVVGGDQTWLSFLGSLYVIVYFLRMHVWLSCVCFRFSVLSQEIGWEERTIRNDLFCVGCDVKP